jgi:hypothetical protein
MTWKNTIKKEYGMPDDEDLFNKLGILQNRIQYAIEYAEKLKGNERGELKEIIAILSQAEELALKAADNLM